MRASIGVSVLDVIDAGLLEKQMGFWTTSAILLGAIVVGVLVLGFLFKRKLAAAADAWQLTATELGLGFRAVPAKVGEISGTLDGFDVHVDIDNTASEGAETYTRIRVELPVVLSESERQCAMEVAQAELAGSSHGFEGRLEIDGVIWMRPGITFDSSNLKRGIRQAVAAAAAARRSPKKKPSPEKEHRGQ